MSQVVAEVGANLLLDHLRGVSARPSAFNRQMAGNKALNGTNGGGLQPNARGPLNLHRE
jgi:hypothetical protein